MQWNQEGSYLLNLDNVMQQSASVSASASVQRIFGFMQSCYSNKMFAVGLVKMLSVSILWQTACSHWISKKHSCVMGKTDGPGMHKLMPSLAQTSAAALRGMLTL